MLGVLSITFFEVKLELGGTPSPLLIFRESANLIPEKFHPKGLKMDQKALKWTLVLKIDLKGPKNEFLNHFFSCEIFVVAYSVPKNSNMNIRFPI